jgi:lysophospholipase L1-like esterase
MLALVLAACGTPDRDPGPRLDPAPRTLVERCFPTSASAELGPVPDYSAFDLPVPAHCAGTGFQRIADLDRVVFVGDSITAGTPPTPEPLYYRNLLVAQLEAAFGHALETQDCSEWGARVDDLLQDDDQLARCLGADGTDERATLLVFTMGGNDGFAFAEQFAAGATEAEVGAQVDEAVRVLDEAMDWVADQRPRFPRGLSVVYANVYEYTDATGDLGVCETASILGFDYDVPGLRAAYVTMNEGWVRVAVEHGFDVVFLLEHFCGHGFLAGDPENECFRGADAEVWFDGTCIHPNPTGHQVIADLFTAVVTNGPMPAAIAP